MQNQIQRITKEINGLKYTAYISNNEIKGITIESNLIGKKNYFKIFIFLFKSNLYKISKHRKAF